MTTRQFVALEVPTEELVVSPINVRRDVGDVSELADSIREQGILEPLVVRPTPDGKYEVIIGSRRLAASKIIGLSLIPVIVQDISDADAIVRSLVENLQRGDFLSFGDYLWSISVAPHLRQRLTLGYLCSNILRE